MRRRMKTIAIGSAVVWLCAAGPSGLGFGAAAHGQTEETPSVGEQSTQALANWLRMTNPGEPHMVLASRVGEWKVTFRSWVTRDAPANEAQGKATREMLLDGRVLEERVDIQLPGPAYQGISHFGFDNVKREYWWHRFDNLSTWITRAQSATPGDDGSLTFHVTMTDVEKSEGLPASLIIRIDGDREVHEWHQAGADGEVFKTVEYIYERIIDEPAEEESAESS